MPLKVRAPCHRASCHRAPCHRKLLLLLPSYLGGGWGRGVRLRHCWGTLARLRAALTRLPGLGTSSSAESPGLPLWAHLHRIQGTHVDLLSLHIPFTELVLFNGRGHCFDYFGSTDCPLYFTDNEFRIKTRGPLRPGPSFYGYLT